MTGAESHAGTDVAPGVSGPALLAKQPADNSLRIRVLNDQFRQTLVGGRVVMTAGVRALDKARVAELLGLLQGFDQFDNGNDPYGEHDFGRVMLDGSGFYFKIDYYDRSLDAGSPNPADEAVTVRVMTIMREGEY